MRFEAVKLSEVADIIVGFAFKSQDFNTNGIGVRLVRGKNITRRSLRWGEDTRWWNDFSFNLDRYYLREKDIVIGMDGSLVGKNYAKINASDLPLLLVQRVACIRAKEEVSQDYLWQIIATPLFENYIDAVKTGTTIPHISGKQIGEYEIPYCNAETQERIASILSVTEEKIRLNTAINENLESQAQAIFKDMIADVQEQVPFTSIIQVFGGGTPKTSNQEYWNGKIPFFTPKDTGNPYVLTTEKNITPLGLNNCNSRLYPVNTVFLTARGTVGKVSLAGVPMSMNQSCYALVGKDGIHQIIVYHYVLETVKALKHKASGAVFDAIITRDFDTERVPALSSEQINGYIAVAEPIYNEILNRTLENKRLEELRDTLLPKLMNGEIDVSEVKI